MPVVVFANPKGGSSKSTSCLVLAQTLASAGAKIAVIDADRNAPLVDWRSGKSRSPVHVVGEVEQGKILRVIEAERSRQQFVFVDLEGSASQLMTRAVSRADLVIIPLQPSGLDARQAARAVELIQVEEETLGRQVKFRVLLTRTGVAIPTKLERRIIGDLEAAGLPVFKQHLHELQAYKAIFDLRCALDELDPKAMQSASRAILDAQKLVDELVDILTEEPANV
jgi:chromosome partitioning protein